MHPAVMTNPAKAEKPSGDKGEAVVEPKDIKRQRPEAFWAMQNHRSKNRGSLERWIFPLKAIKRLGKLLLFIFLRDPYC